MAEIVVNVFAGYGAIGLGVAALFLLIGMERVEPGSRGAYAFRPLLVPGCVAIWPLVLYRWYQLERKAKSP